MADSLVLGWKIDDYGDPQYWTDGKAKVGLQNDSDLIIVSADKIDTHTILIAQSGSGKSFFLGRLIEEILLKTKANCLIFDPNGDFRRIHQVNKTIWKKPKFLRGKGGKLPHEKNSTIFAESWNSITKKIMIFEHTEDEPYEKLKISWPSLSVDFLAEDLDPFLKSDLYHCHVFVKSIAYILRQKARSDHNSIDLIKECGELYTSFKKGEDFFKMEVGKQIDEIIQKRSARRQRYATTMRNKLLINSSFLKRRMQDRMERALFSLKYVSDEAARFYFAKANEYKSSGIIDELTPYLKTTKRDRLEVIDLPSLPSTKERSLVIDSILSEKWDRAKLSWEDAMDNPIESDNRVPTFIIVEEAHHIIPAETTDTRVTSLREQFRTIASEGRKYGLFLILVSQRPDKLDPLVISECGNKAIMRLDSELVANVVKDKLGFNDVNTIIDTIKFQQGRVLLSGNWSPIPQKLYSAARRTVEGGRNLRSNYWATAYEKSPVQDT